MRRTGSRMPGDLDTLETDLDGLNCDHAPFSLNKRGRWNLPGHIQQAMLDGEPEFEAFDIELVERYKVKLGNSSDGVSVCIKDSPRRGSRVLLRRHGHINVGSFLSINHDARSAQPQPHDAGTSADQEGEVFEQRSRVRYDVFYPLPVQCSIRHIPKFIGYDTRDPESMCYLNSRRRGIRHRKRKSKHILRDAIGLLECDLGDQGDALGLAECDFEDHGHEGLDKNVVTRKTPDLHVSTLGDFIEHAIKAVGMESDNQKKRRQNRTDSEASRSNVDTKGRKINDGTIIKMQSKMTIGETIERTQSLMNRDKPVITDRKSSRMTTLTPVAVALPFEQITPEYFESVFGSRYLECSCYPRKLVLDISDKVSSVDKFKSHKPGVRTVNACIVITVDRGKSMKTTPGHAICNVSLNTNFSDAMDNVKIDTLSENAEITVDEVITKTTQFIQNLPDNVIARTDCEPCYLSPREREKSNLEEFANCSTTSVKVDEEYLFNFFTSHGDIQVTKFGNEINGDSRLLSANVKQFDTSEDDCICSICFDQFVDNTLTTALTSCNHVFCNHCWSKHLATRISNGAVTLSCPASGCTSSVDQGTILSLISMPVIMTYAKRLHDVECGRHAQVKWCPNERCGRMLRVTASNVRLAKCRCGEECCFDCLGKPHWPADCESVKRYQDVMVANGDAGIVPFEASVGVIVDGKNCPHCHTFVEKHGGCPFMVCVCGRSFCWGCGGTFDYDRLHLNCDKVGFDDKHGTVQRNVAPHDALARLKRRRWYKLALTHRLAQHPVKFLRLKNASKSLSKKIKELLARSARRGVFISLDFHKDGTYLREADKTDDFLNSTIELYKEVSVLAENVALVLDTQYENRNVLDRSLQYTATRLSNFVTIIFDLFTNESERGINDTLSRLKRVRRHARNIIRALVNKMLHKRRVSNDENVKTP